MLESILSLKGTKSLSNSEQKSIVGGDVDGFDCASVYRYCDSHYPNDYDIFDKCMSTVDC